MLNRIAFSESSLDSRSRLTLFPSFLTRNPATSVGVGLRDPAPLN